MSKEAIRQVLEAWATDLEHGRQVFIQATTLRKVAAALAEPPAREWQPIETAPKTGRELILLLPPSKWPQLAYSNTWWTTGCSVENKPTHWIPIPPVDAALREALAEQPAQRKPLTYEEITAISKQVAEGGPKDSIDRFVRAIEAAHNIKEDT